MLAHALAFDFKMTFIVTKTDDGLYHVQNIVASYSGQHHVHSEKGFNYWKKNGKIADADIKTGTGSCTCGLKPGDVREYDGQLWHNAKFE